VYTGNLYTLIWCVGGDVGIEVVDLGGSSGRCPCSGFYRGCIVAIITFDLGTDAATKGGERGHAIGQSGAGMGAAPEAL
jgi:hypothetical protein